MATPRSSPSWPSSSPSRPPPCSCRSASARWPRPPRALGGRAGLTRLVAVEPEGADCLRRSIAAGAPVTVPGPHRSVMAGLNCGTPSAIAWPAVKAAFDEFLAIPDAVADDGMRRLAALGLDRGECAGGVVGAAARAAAGDGPVVLLLTEGVTDPAHFEQVVGRPAGRCTAP